MKFFLSFRQGTMYRYEIGKYDVDSLNSFSSKWYKNVKGVKVPIEKSWFDRTIDKIVTFLKQQETYYSYILITLISITLFLMLIVTFFFIKKSQKVEKHKTTDKYD